MTETTWPAPRDRRGSHVQHSWRCPRRAAIVETVRKDPTGRGWVVDMCQACGGTDLAHRQRHPDPPEAA